MRHVSQTSVFIVAFNWSSGLLLQEEGLYACQRGCRLFSICQFVRDSEDLNQTKSECESSTLSSKLALTRLTSLTRLIIRAITCSAAINKRSHACNAYNQPRFLHTLVHNKGTCSSKPFVCNPALPSVTSHLLQTSAACREAYKQADEQYACNIGCQNQLPFAEQRQEQV